MKRWLAVGLLLLLGVTPVRASASGIDSIAMLNASCRPFAVVAYHRSGPTDVPERVWVMSDRSRAVAKAGSLAGSGRRVRVEPAFGVRVFTAIVLHESGGHPWIIGDNASPHRAYTYGTKAEAVAKAYDLYASGHRNLDLGLAQLNSMNLAGLGLSIDRAFDPCTNVKAGGLILARSYYGASQIAGYSARALEMSLRAYNTGHYYVGDAYASSVWSIAQALPPRIGDRENVR